MTPSQLTLLAAVISLYLSLIRYFCYQRRNGSNARFTNRPLSSMTILKAHEIISELRELKFSHTKHTAMKISLLKVQLLSPIHTYTAFLTNLNIKIGSTQTMTKLFLITGQLNPRNASKRAADTEILLSKVHDRLPVRIHTFLASRL